MSDNLFDKQPRRPLVSTLKPALLGVGIGLGGAALIFTQPLLTIPYLVISAALIAWLYSERRASNRRIRAQRKARS